MSSSSTDLAQAVVERFAREPDWLSSACGLTPEALRPLLRYYLPLAEEIARGREQKGAPLTVGVQGPQAAGKTTLTHLLQRVFCDVAGWQVATLSIDDIYLTRAERASLAQRVHPLFRTRGVPGTHDVELGIRVLDGLVAPGVTAIPRFDKGRDDRMAHVEWPQCAGPCDIVLFEGLWIGLPALDDRTLAAPVNALEAHEDPQSVWRRYANTALAERYPALFARCELLVHFQVPDFGCVKRWRSGAEHALRAKLEATGADTTRVMDDAALARFFDHYERFSLHAMKVMPDLADVVLRLDQRHHLVGSTLPVR